MWLVIFFSVRVHQSPTKTTSCLGRTTFRAAFETPGTSKTTQTGQLYTHKSKTHKWGKWAGGSTSKGRAWHAAPPNSTARDIQPPWLLLTPTRPSTIQTNISTMYWISSPSFCNNGHMLKVETMMNSIDFDGTSSARRVIGIRGTKMLFS